MNGFIMNLKNYEIMYVCSITAVNNLYFYLYLIRIIRIPNQQQKKKKGKDLKSKINQKVSLLNFYQLKVSNASVFSKAFRF